MGDGPVLVHTALDDPTADLVIEELYRRGVPVIRFDAADFPHALSVSAEIGAGQHMRGVLRTATRTVDLSEVRSLYHRRPSPYAFPGLDEQDEQFAAAQARYGLGGVLRSLPGCRYVNHPHAVAAAEFKPSQLAAAVELELPVPSTLITNDPDEARQFFDANGPVVYKALRDTPFKVEEQPHTIWVRDVLLDEIDQSVAGAMHLFQAKVDKIADVRVTVVGDQVFCVRIDSDLLDWRYDYDALTYTVVTPPLGLHAALQAYLRRFDLAFGCFDFAVADGGQWVFLECNPNGQWAWLEPATGLPLTSAFADLLERRCR